MSISRCRGLALMLLAGGLATANAAILVDVSGPNDDNLQTTDLGGIPAIGFSLASDATNVSITASLISFFGGIDGNADYNLTAFLTRQVGPGTTQGTDEVQSNSTLISIPNSPFSSPFTITPYTVFSGLSLTAGNYYLTLSGSPSTGAVQWVGSQTADLVTSGTIVAPSLLVNTPDGTYLPASTFDDLSGPSGSGLWFQVTGDAADPTPEPASMLLVLPGLALAWMRRRSLVAQKN